MTKNDFGLIHISKSNVIKARYIYNLIFKFSGIIIIIICHSMQSLFLEWTVFEKYLNFFSATIIRTVAIIRLCNLGLYVYVIHLVIFAFFFKTNFEIWSVRWFRPKNTHTLTYQTDQNISTTPQKYFFWLQPCIWLSEMI